MAKMKAGDIYPKSVAPVLIQMDEIVIPRLMIWGFKNYQGKGVIANARSENARIDPNRWPTSWEKRFRDALANRRCVIPSTGFYEWDKTEEKKKYLFNIPASGMLYMAGLYEQYDGENRFVILTTDANSSVKDVHPRMPVVIPKDKMGEWLFDFNRADNILFGPHPSLEMQLIV